MALFLPTVYLLSRSGTTFVLFLPYSYLITILSHCEYRFLLTSGALTSTQADALNDAVNAAIAATKGYSYSHDGDFNGQKGELRLGSDTDGINTTIAMDPDADFLHVYSLLGSTQETIGVTPLDVVMVLDVSGSMGNYAAANSKIAQSLQAMNDAIDTLMNLNINNRVGVVVFASRPAVLMPLGRYKPQTMSVVTNASSTHNGSNTTTQRSVYIGVTRQHQYSTTPYYDYTLTAVTSAGGRTSMSTQGEGNGNYNGSYNDDNGNNGTWANDTWTNIGSNTNMDSGFWTGLSLLASADNTVVTIENKAISRIPSFIFLGDGDPHST